MTARGVLLVFGVAAAFGAIFVPIAARVNAGRDLTIDGDRLRRTYVALALYAAEHDGLPAPNLGLVRQDLDPIDLRSVADPQASGPGASGPGASGPGGARPGPFPLDPFQPGLALRSPTRVSWSYRWHWSEAGAPRRLSPSQGLLADPWLGLRIAEDGARLEVPKGTGFKALFGK